MWKLWHRLFGWHYMIVDVKHEDDVGRTWYRQLIIRVHHDARGRGFVRLGRKISYVPPEARYLTK